MTWNVEIQHQPQISPGTTTSLLLIALQAQNEKNGVWLNYQPNLGNALLSFYQAQVG